MHLVNVNIKNYLQGKCFITDIAGIKGSIGRGFWQGIITVSPLYLPEARSWGKPLFKEDLEALRDAIKGIEDKSVIDNIDVRYL